MWLLTGLAKGSGIFLGEALMKLGLPLLMAYKGKRREWRKKAVENIFWSCLVLDVYPQGTEEVWDPGGRHCGTQLRQK